MGFFEKESDENIVIIEVDLRFELPGITQSQPLVIVPSLNHLRIFALFSSPVLSLKPRVKGLNLLEKARLEQPNTPSPNVFFIGVNTNGVSSLPYSTWWLQPKQLWTKVLRELFWQYEGSVLHRNPERFETISPFTNALHRTFSGSFFQSMHEVLMLADFPVSSLSLENCNWARLSGVTNRRRQNSEPSMISLFLLSTVTSLGSCAKYESSEVFPQTVGNALHDSPGIVPPPDYKKVIDCYRGTSIGF